MRAPNPQMIVINDNSFQSPRDEWVFLLDLSKKCLHEAPSIRCMVKMSSELCSKTRSTISVMWIHACFCFVSVYLYSGQWKRATNEHWMHVFEMVIHHLGGKKVNGRSSYRKECEKNKERKPPSSQSKTVSSQGDLRATRQENDFSLPVSSVRMQTIWWCICLLMCYLKNDSPREI